MQFRATFVNVFRREDLAYLAKAGAKNELVAHGIAITPDNRLFARDIRRGRVVDTSLSRLLALIGPTGSTMALLSNEGGNNMLMALRLAILVTLLLPLMGWSQSAKPPIRVGLLLPYTGPFATTGEDTTRGFELYLAKIGTRAGGRSIELFKADTETKPEVGLTKARKLVESDRVDVLVGPVSSAVAFAVRDYVHRQGIPLIIPVAGSRDLTAPGKASSWIFRTAETSDQANYPMGLWVAKNTRYRKMIVIASDFVVGHHQAQAFMAAFRSAGGEIVKEIYAPLGTADFAPYMAQLTGLKADAIYAWFGGADSVRFVKAYKECRMAEKFPLIGHNALVDDDVLPSMGDAALGILSMGHYSAALNTSENRSFVQEYETKYKTWPSRHAENGNVAAQLIVAAVGALKGEVSDRMALREALGNAAPQIRAPRGAIKFDRYQQAITNQYVMRVEKQGNRLVNAIVDRVENVSQEDTWKWWNKK